MTTKTFDPNATIDEVLAFAGASDVASAIAEVGNLEDVLHTLKVFGPWQEADDSSAELDARNHLVIRIRE